MWEMDSVIKIGGNKKKKSNKTNKKSKRLQLQGEIGGSGWIRINYYMRKKNEKWSN